MVGAAAVAKIPGKVFGVCVLCRIKVPEDKHQFMEGPFSVLLPVYTWACYTFTVVPY